MNDYEREILRNMQFNVYRNALRERVNKRFMLQNLKKVKNKPGVRIQLKANANKNNKTFINIEPVNNRSVYISYGRTASNKRKKGLGLNIRRFAVNAARNTKMNLYQQTKNLNRLLADPNNMPYSGIIMERLGAKLVNRRQVPHAIGKGSANNAIWFFYSSMGS
jgi:hypothetical protein